MSRYGEGYKPPPDREPPPPPPPPPVGPPNRWVVCGDPIAFDIVTGNPRIDREIARSRGLYPQPWWRRLWWALFGGAR